jgi:ketosteroid isomerase-like protein
MAGGARQGGHGKDVVSAQRGTYPETGRKSRRAGEQRCAGYGYTKEEYTMTRTSQEVFDAHQSAFNAGDLDMLLADYADDAIMVTLEGSAVGKQAIRGMYEYFHTAFPNLKVDFQKTVIEDDIVLILWSADSDVATVPQGSATFIIRDGLIQRQAEFFIPVPKGQ